MVPRAIEFACTNIRSTMRFGAPRRARATRMNLIIHLIMMKWMAVPCWWRAGDRRLSCPANHHAGRPGGRAAQPHSHSPLSRPPPRRPPPHLMREEINRHQGAINDNPPRRPPPHLMREEITRHQGAINGNPPPRPPPPHLRCLARVTAHAAWLAAP